MIVTVTAENIDGAMKYLSADAPTYDEALAQAEAQIPEGFRMINIRTDR